LIFAAVHFSAGVPPAWSSPALSKTIASTAIVWPILRVGLPTALGSPDMLLLPEPGSCARLPSPRLPPHAGQSSGLSYTALRSGVKTKVAGGGAAGGPSQPVNLYVCQFISNCPGLCWGHPTVAARVRVHGVAKTRVTPDSPATGVRWRGVVPAHPTLAPSGVHLSTDERAHPSECGPNGRQSEPRYLMSGIIAGCTALGGIRMAWSARRSSAPRLSARFYY